MSNFLVLSIDSGILLFAWSYMENEVEFVEFDSLSIFQLSSSLFDLFKLSLDNENIEEHSSNQNIYGFGIPESIWKKNNPLQLFFFDFFTQSASITSNPEILQDTTVAEMYTGSTSITSVNGNSREAAAAHESRQLWSNVSKY